MILLILMLICINLLGLVSVTYIGLVPSVIMLQVLANVAALLWHKEADQRIGLERALKTLHGAIKKTMELMEDLNEDFDKEQKENERSKQRKEGETPGEKTEKGV